MTAGTPYVPHLVPHIANGVHTQLDYADTADRHGAENLRTATENFAIHYNGALVQFHAGIAVRVDVSLAAALDAAGAPVLRVYAAPAAKPEHPAPSA